MGKVGPEGIGNRPYTIDVKLGRTLTPSDTFEEVLDDCMIARKVHLLIPSFQVWH